MDDNTGSGGQADRHGVAAGQRGVATGRDSEGNTIVPGDRNAVAGRDVGHEDSRHSSSAQVHVALNRVADELSQMEELVHQVSELRADMERLVRELVGDERFRSAGIAQRVAEAERQLFLGRILLGVATAIELAQWAVLLYHALTYGRG